MMGTDISMYGARTKRRATISAPTEKRGKKNEMGADCDVSRLQGTKGNPNRAEEVEVSELQAEARCRRHTLAENAEGRR